MIKKTFSIITVTFNSASTIEDTIYSVLNQTYSNIEYIIVDGASTDNTINIVKSFGNKISKFISEKDNGIYDAINKGIKLATGDIIGILNSDDMYISNNIIVEIVHTFNKFQVDSIFGDVVFVKKDSPNKIVRYYSSKSFNSDKFRYGFMPAHPSFFVKKEIINRLGVYKTYYKIASDFELLIRYLYTNRISYHYMNKVLVKMRLGGVSNSSIKNRLLLNKEIKRACRENGIRTNYFLILSKYFIKIFELFNLKKSISI